MYYQLQFKLEDNNVKILTILKHYAMKVHGGVKI